MNNFCGVEKNREGVGISNGVSDGSIIVKWASQSCTPASELIYHIYDRLCV